MIDIRSDLPPEGGVFTLQRLELKEMFFNQSSFLTSNQAGIFFGDLRKVDCACYKGNGPIPTESDTDRGDAQLGRRSKSTD